MSEHAPDHADATTAAIEQLSSTAQQLSALIEGQPEFVLHHKSAPDAWSVTEILGHFVDNERDVVGPNLAAILTRDNPALSQIDQDAAVRAGNYHLANASDLVIAFDERRTETVAQLHALPPAAWERLAHDATGATHTLAALVQGQAGHDRAHLDQIAATLRHTPGANS